MFGTATRTFDGALETACQGRSAAARVSTAQTESESAACHIRTTLPAATLWPGCRYGSTRNAPRGTCASALGVSGDASGRAVAPAVGLVGAASWAGATAEPTRMEHANAANFEWTVMEDSTFAYQMSSRIAIIS